MSRDICLAPRCLGLVLEITKKGNLGVPKPSHLRAPCWGLVVPRCASVVARVRRALDHASLCALRPVSSPILRAAVESVRVRLCPPASGHDLPAKMG